MINSIITSLFITAIFSSIAISISWYKMLDISNIDIELEFSISTSKSGYHIITFYIYKGTRASPWGRASSCVRPSLVMRIQVTKEYPSGLVMSKLKGNAESTGRTTRSTSYFHQYFKTTIYIHQESFKQIDWILRKFIQPNIRLNIQNVNRIDTDLF